MLSAGLATVVVAGAHTIGISCPRGGSPGTLRRRAMWRQDSDPLGGCASHLDCSNDNCLDNHWPARYHRVEPADSNCNSGTRMSATIPHTTEVVVIGGGPAGSTTSTLLAQKGHRVDLFEREKGPRFHIGEPLIPQTYFVLERLNMLPKMKRSHFVKKYSVQFVNQRGKLSRSEERRVGKEGKFGVAEHRETRE